MKGVNQPGIVLAGLQRAQGKHVGSLSDRILLAHGLQRHRVRHAAKPFMIHRTLYNADPSRESRPPRLQVQRRIAAVRDQVVRPPNAARHDHIEVVMERGHGSFGVVEKGQIVNGQDPSSCAYRRHHKIGCVKEVDAAPGQPLNPRKRKIEAVPHARQVPLREEGKRVQRQRAVRLFVLGNPSGNEKRYVIARILRNQRTDLPAYDATDARGLAHGRRVINNQLHCPLKVHKRLAAKFQKSTTPMEKNLANM